MSSSIFFFFADARDAAAGNRPYQKPLLLTAHPPVTVTSQSFGSLGKKNEIHGMFFYLAAVELVSSALRLHFLHHQ